MTVGKTISNTEEVKTEVNPFTALVVVLAIISVGIGISESSVVAGALFMGSFMAIMALAFVLVRTTQWLDNKLPAIEPVMVKRARLEREKIEQQQQENDNDDI